MDGRRVVKEGDVVVFAAGIWLRDGNVEGGAVAVGEVRACEDVLIAEGGRGRACGVDVGVVGCVVGVKLGGEGAALDDLIGATAGLREGCDGGLVDVGGDRLDAIGVVIVVMWVVGGLDEAIDAAVSDAKGVKGVLPQVEVVFRRVCSERIELRLDVVDVSGSIKSSV